MREIYLGRLVKAFGIRGELKFHPSDDFWEDVLQSRQLRLRLDTNGETTRAPVEFTRTRPHGKSYVVTMEGVTDRNTAQNLVGGELFIDERRIDVKRPDGLLPYQLVGMRAKTEEGKILGKLTSVVYSPAHPIYEITDERGVSFLVPAVPEFLVSVDAEKRVLIVRPVPGLIED